MSILSYLYNPIVDTYSIINKIRLLIKLINSIDNLVLFVEKNNIGTDKDVIKVETENINSDLSEGDLDEDADVVTNEVTESGNIESESGNIESENGTNENKTSDDESEDNLTFTYDSIDKSVLQEYITKLNIIDDLLISVTDKGCIYTKFAQWYISNKLSVFPEVIKEFEDIFDQCPYHEDDYSFNLIKNELNMTDEELENYLDINTLERIASGSIGQVYSCKLKNSEYKYDKVIIKVKHPNVDNEVEDFSKIVSWFTYFQSKHFFRKRFNLYFDFQEFMDNIYYQIDFNVEANNGRKFRQLYEDSPTVYIPEIINSSKSILIAEFVDKVEIDDLSEFQKSFAVLNLSGFMFDSLLTTNFVHGDLHCKNWSMMENKDESTNKKFKYKLVIFDYGICYSSESVNFNIKTFEALQHARIYEIVQLMKHSRGLIDINDFINNEAELFVDEELLEKVNIIDNTIKTPNSQGVFLLVNKVLEEEDIIICKFLMNTFIILFMVDSLLVKNNIHREINYGNQLCNHLRDFKMDLMTYCDSKNTYPRLSKYLSSVLKENDYNDKKISQDELTINLFNSIESSKLTFKPISID